MNAYQTQEKYIFVSTLLSVCISILHNTFTLNTLPAGEQLERTDCISLIFLRPAAQEGLNHRCAIEDISDIRIRI